MAKKDPYNVGSNFDWSIIEQAGLPEDQVERIKQAMADEIKANQRGRTEAQEEAARMREQYEQLYGNYNQQHQRLQQYENWRQQVQPYLNQYTQQTQQALTQQQAAAQQAAQATMGRKRKLTEQWKDGEISYEQMQRATQDLDEEFSELVNSLDQRFQQVNQQYAPILNRVQQELPRYAQTLGQIQQEVQRLRNDQQSTVASVLPVAMQISRYQIQHPDRDIEEIYRVWGERQLGSFEEAAWAVYGEEDREAEFERLYKERREAEREGERRKRESRQLYRPETGVPLEDGSEEGVPVDQRVNDGDGIAWMRPKRREQMQRQQTAQQGQPVPQQQQAPVERAVPELNPNFRRTEGQVRDALYRRFFEEPAPEAV